MTRTKRKALLATVLGLAAAAAAIPMVVSGTGEVVVQLFEVAKNVGTSKLSVCTIGKVTEEYPKGFPGTTTEQGRTVREWESDEFDLQICEDWKTRPREFGGLGGKDLNFISGGKFPKELSQTDICLNMNRNETFVDQNYYWLHKRPT